MLTLLLHHVLQCSYHLDEVVAPVGVTGQPSFFPERGHLMFVSSSSLTSSSSLVEGALAAAFAFVKASDVVREAVVFMPSELGLARSNRELALAHLKCALSDEDTVAELGVEFIDALRTAAFSGSFDAVEAIAAEVRG